MTVAVSWDDIASVVEFAEARNARGEWAKGHDTASATASRDAKAKLAADRAERHHGTVDVASGITDPAVRAAAVAEVQSGLDRMARFVPGVVGKIRVSLDDRAGDDPDDVGSSFPWGQIDLAPSATTAVGGAAHSRRVIGDAVRDHFFTRVDPGKVSLAEYAVAHETGHHIEYQLDKDSFVTEDGGLWGRIADTIGAPRPKVFGSGRASLAGWADDHQDRIAAGVSKYGAGDLPELKAELWAEYTLSDHPRQAAKLYGDYILAHQGGAS